MPRYILQAPNRIFLLYKQIYNVKIKYLYFILPTTQLSPQSEEIDTKRTFCPLENRQPILDMMQSHYCAHPLIPGYSHPSPAGIKRWAVKQMYGYCVEHDLRETWAYLWENWYREGRWEIWARSAHDEIPTLKTTMVIESQ